MRFSAVTHAPRPAALGPQGLVQAGDASPRHGPWHDRLTVAAAALGTLTVIMAASVTVGDRPVDEPDDPRAQLTHRAQRAADSLPGAYQSGDSVIMPAVAGHIVRSSYVPPERVRTLPLPLYVHGLVDYEAVRSPVGAPSWTTSITDEDKVFVDVGQLFFTCVSWPGEYTCSPALLAEGDGRFFFYQAGIGSGSFLQPGSDMMWFVFDAVMGGERVRLVFGGMPGTDGQSVEVTLADGTVLPGQISPGRPFPDATVWWAATSQPVEAVTVLGPGDTVLERLETSP